MVIVEHEVMHIEINRKIVCILFLLVSVLAENAVLCCMVYDIRKANMIRFMEYLCCLSSRIVSAVRQGRIDGIGEGREGIGWYRSCTRGRPLADISK